MVTPAINVPPGFCIAGVNYEPQVRGYRRSEGYERFDGRPKPSLASYWTMNFDAGTTQIVAGNAVTGATSGATGIALSDATLSSGSYGAGTAAGTIILYNVTGTFVDNENLQVASANVALVNGEAVENGTVDAAQHKTNLHGAIEARRAAISKPAGSGPIRGVWTYRGDVYAFRDDATASQCVMHKATTSGWVAQTFGHTLPFTAGTAEFAEGEVITGGTSGATATVRRVILTSGAWTGTAAGYLVISNITGTFSAGETITSASGSATNTGAQIAITLPAGGTYRFYNHNFYGASNLERMYFVNGVGTACEWDGTYLVPIETGLASSIDKPKWISVYKDHLFLGFDGGSLQHSGIGKPTSFLVIDGAGEIGLGADLTGLISDALTSLVILGRNRVAYLVGTSSADFQLKILSGTSGAMVDTGQIIGEPYFVDDQGIRKLSTVQAFGDWNIGTISRLVEPFMTNKKDLGIAPVGSLIVKTKDQYRLFYADKSGLTVYLGRKYPEILPFSLGFTPTTVISGEDANGNEILLAGDDTGWVYEIDAGTSWDGQTLTAYLRFAYNTLGYINYDKRFHKAILEIDGSQTTDISVAVEFSYGDPDAPPAPETAFSVSGGGGFWNESNWNQFFWSAPVQGRASADINGVGINVSIAVMSDTIYEDPHTLSALTITYSPRRMLR